MRVMFAALILSVSSVAAYADTTMIPEGQERYRMMPPPPVPPPPPREATILAPRIEEEPIITARPAPPPRKVRQAPPRKTVRRAPPKKRADPCEAKCASALATKDERIAELEAELKALKSQAPPGSNPFFPPGNGTAGAAPPPPPDCCEKVPQIVTTNERLLRENADIRDALWWHRWIGIGAIILLLLAIVLTRKGDRIFFRR